MEDCIFCKLVKGEIPSYKVYEDDNFYAFLDINPVNLGHTLVIPKDHREDLFAMSSKVLADLGDVLQKVGRAVKEGTGAEGLNLGMNNGEVAGQVIMHAHIHLIPRFAEDGLRHWPAKEGVTPEALEEAKSKISRLL